MKVRTPLAKGSGNIFSDLGFSETEAQNLALRSDLMIRIEKLVRDSGMTQQQAAKTLGVTQPRLNALLKGKIADFSLDALVNMLARAGMQVKMTVKKAA
jgi:predicted XRE-type DNA-binding protein